MLTGNLVVAADDEDDEEEAPHVGATETGGIAAAPVIGNGAGVLLIVSFDDVAAPSKWILSWAVLLLDNANALSQYLH